MEDRGCLSTVAAVIGILVGLIAIADWFGVERGSVPVASSDLVSLKEWIQDHRAIAWLAGLALIGSAWSSVFAIADELYDLGEGMFVVTGTAVFFAGLTLGWLWLFGSVVSIWLVIILIIVMILAGIAALVALFDVF